MTSWIAIKHAAREQREAAEQEAGPGASLETIVQAAVGLAEVYCEAVPPDDPLLGGGEARLDRESYDVPIVWYRDDVPLETALFLVTHELAHFWLHEGSFTCGPAHIDQGAEEEDVPVDRAEPYSPRERKERQANIWAREFLLPAPTLRNRYLQTQITAASLAAELGLSEGLVRLQMARALLTVEPVGPPPVPEAVPQLKGKQCDAAKARTGPVLVIAGPGSGKTSTLAGRIDYLLGEEQVQPEDIIALTFTRKAAEEMRARVALARPKEAEIIYLDTIHAYCYDLLLRRGFWPKAGVIDGARALGVLENLLPKLPLRHFQYLPEPVAKLEEVLRAIGRAKNDLVGPKEFSRQAATFLQAAQRRLHDALPGRQREDALDDVRRAERATEAAAVYGIYQSRLEEIKRYDFGDLVMQAVQLLESDPQLLEEERGDRHVLVDEFQDLNVAGARFVKLLASDGRRLWAVGDPLQAIYRFRGASTSGLLSFEDDYPGAEIIQLEQNYRSKQPIIDVFRAMVPHMRAAPAAPPAWIADRGAGGSIMVHVAESPEAELRGLAKAIKAHASTTPYREQAVLARKHNHLAEIADALEAEDVPVLFLAGFFERDEVRDMLALVELSCERSGRALMRVATFPEYRIPRADVLALLKAARDRDVSFPGGLALADELDELSPEGKQGFALLRAHLGGMHPGIHPWTLLSDYLFNKSHYLESYPADDSTGRPILNQRCRVALFQLLQIAHSYSFEGSSHRDPKWTFLQYVRHLASSAEHRQLAEVPEWAAGIDAVRLLTVHGAKGLEFGAVHLPKLNLWDFHMGKYNGERRPLPPDLLADDPAEAHYEEEECLFFVAASRARDHLALSRSVLRYNAHGVLRSAKPFSLLEKIAPVLPSSPTGRPTWKGMPSARPSPNQTPLTEKPDFDIFDLEAYLDCSRRYGYERELGLDARTETTAYRKLVQCVRTVVGEVVEARRSGETLDPESAVSRLHMLWDEWGDPAHPYADLYREEGERRVRAACHQVVGKDEAFHMSLSLERPRGHVLVTPDLILLHAEGSQGQIRVQRWTAGELGWIERARPLYAVLQAAAKEMFGQGNIVVEAVSVAAGVVERIDPRREGLEEIDHAIAGIQKRSFPARPNPFRCPRCPYYFICPTEGADAE